VTNMSEPEEEMSPHQFAEWVSGLMDNIDGDVRRLEGRLPESPARVGNI